MSEMMINSFWTCKFLLDHPQGTSRGSSPKVLPKHLVIGKILCRLPLKHLKRAARGIHPGVRKGTFSGHGPKTVEGVLSSFPLEHLKIMKQPEADILE